VYAPIRDRSPSAGVIPIRLACGGSTVAAEIDLGPLSGGLYSFLLAASFDAGSSWHVFMNTVPGTPASRGLRYITNLGPMAVAGNGTIAVAGYSPVPASYLLVLKPGGQLSGTRIPLTVPPTVSAPTASGLAFAGPAIRIDLAWPAPGTSGPRYRSEIFGATSEGLSWHAVYAAPIRTAPF
jgi:hypothetical protein